MPASLVQKPSVKKQIHRRDAKNAKVVLIETTEQVIPAKAGVAVQVKGETGNR